MTIQEKKVTLVDELSDDEFNLDDDVDEEEAINNNLSQNMA